MGGGRATDTESKGGGRATDRLSESREEWAGSGGGSQEPRTGEPRGNSREEDQGEGKDRLAFKR